MIDPITALAAISSAVTLVKKVAKTVDDVASLGPVLGKYFEAKEQAIAVVKQAKAGDFKGSALGQALELELAIEQAKEFESQVQMLFFQSNKMDVWQRIVKRAQNMEIEAAHATRRKREAKEKRAKEIEEIATIAAVVVLTLLLLFSVLWLVLPKLR
jgi:hypothetical protein